MATRDHSAGILLYRWGSASLEVFIGHMGGPFWQHKQSGSWSIPKGLVEAGELPLNAARREFEEEIGVPAPELDYALLGEFRYSSGKLVTVFTAESDLQVAEVVSEPMTIEYPRGSGRMATFPEIDEVRWVGVDDARAMLVKGQVPALDALADVA